MLNVIVFDSLLAVCCGYALWRGGAPERMGGAIFLLATGFTVLAAFGSAHRFASVELGIFVVDVATLVALIVLALRADRHWPSWVAGLQIISTAGHAVKLIDPNVIPRAYAFALAFWSYPMLFILVLGTWRHQQRLAKFGADKSWSSFWHRLGPGPQTGPTS